MRLIYIDGDNNPGESSLKGIECLGKDDTVKIFYATSNTFYRSEKNRNMVSNLTSATVLFKEIATGKNAVDFAVAMAAATDYQLLATANKDAVPCIFFISSDNHFKVISATIQSMFSGSKCVTSSDIIGVLVSNPSLFESPGEIKKFFMAAFGNSYGDALYNRARLLFRNQFENSSSTKSGSIFEKCSGILHKAFVRQ